MAGATCHPSVNLTQVPSMTSRTLPGPYIQGQLAGRQPSGSVEGRYGLEIRRKV